MLAVIDNYDSFTWNLVQILGELGAEPRVFRNDAVTPAELRRLGTTCLVVSPGPRTPAEAGISVEAIRRLGPTTPTLGVCLGHQAIGEAYGGRTVRAARTVHGKVSPVAHNGDPLFSGIPSPMRVARYPLAGHGAGAAARPRSHRLERRPGRQRRDPGPPAPRTPRLGSPVPPRVPLHRRRTQAAGEFSGSPRIGAARISHGRERPPRRLKLAVRSGACFVGISHGRERPPALPLPALRRGGSLRSVIGAFHPGPRTLSPVRS